MHTHLNFYHFSEGYASPFTVLAVGGLRQALSIWSWNTIVTFMVLPHLVSFFYVCYHVFTPHSFLFGLLLHVMPKLTAYSVFSTLDTFSFFSF